MKSALTVLRHLPTETCSPVTVSYYALQPKS